MIRPLIVLAMAMTASNCVFADPPPPPDFYPDRAEVVSTAPIYQQINQPHRVCWTDTQSNNDNGNSGDHNYAGAILGGLAGGLLGHTVGAGNGNAAATAVGAVTGAMVGDHLDNQNQDQPPQETQHCEMRDQYVQQLAGYAVTYRYHGQTFATRMPQAPGRFINVNVHVEPARDQQWQQAPVNSGYPPPYSGNPPPYSGNSY